LSKVDSDSFWHYKDLMSRSHLTSFFLLLVILAGCSAPAINPPTSQSGSTNTINFPTSTVTATLQPTATATPTPLVQVAIADLALFEGDYFLARQGYLDAFRSATEPQIKAAALWGLARVEYLDGYYDQSLTYISNLTSSLPDSAQSRLAGFLQGECLDALKRYSDAAQAYQGFLTTNPGLIDSYVQEWMGDAQDNAGDFASAISSYQASLKAPRTGDTTYIEVKIGKMYFALGEYSSSIAIYTDIAARASDDYTRAQMDFLIGQAYLTMGQNDQAYPFFEDAVTKYPQSYDSYSSLVALVDAGIPVDDMQRGLVDYFAGQYGVALAAFNSYLVNNPANDGTVLHYLALSLRENGEYQQAVDDWTQLIEKHPENRYWGAAWDERAYTLWAYMDNFNGAAQSLLDFVTNFPSNENAPIFLNSAARIQERAGNLQEASLTWQRIANEYPGSDLVPDALFEAGIQLYRLAEFSKALVIFQKDMILSNTPIDQARAYLWVGKTQQALKDPSSAQQSFQLAAGLDPTGYYSERARDILLEHPIFSQPKNYSLSFDLVSEKTQAETWIRVTFKLPPETNLDGSGDLGTEPRFLRGSVLTQLGLLDEARLEFEDLRNSLAQDPERSYRLANAMLEMGYYRIAAESSRQLLKLAGLDTYTKMLTAPQYFNHINYGAYYSDLVLAYAQEYGLDPLFLFSMITQESAFEGFVHSGAGARGLMQIIPSTGQTIADTLGWPIRYSSADLYRPLVSIRFGSFYFKSNMTYFNNDLFVTLAAYNAGPGNANVWKLLSGDDPDLFLEVTRFSETRDYIRNIYEIYVVYRSIYSVNP